MPEISRIALNAIINELQEKDGGVEPVIAQTSIEKEKIDVGVPDNVVEIILQKLSNFEEEEQYLEKECTLAKVAEKLQTNSSYLSKVVNNYKEGNFNSYINNLRINYTLKRLNNDPQFRQYSISAIAQEAGYNNAQSFGNAFSKHTGMKPSVFIKQFSKDVR